MRAVAVLVAVCSTGCAALAISSASSSMIYLVVPAGRAEGGAGSISEQARARLEAAERSDRRVAVTDAIAAAKARPDDVRLLRRAAAMARDLGEPGGVAGLEDVLALLARHPCPGLADIAATRAALGDANAAGDMYLRAARECESIDAAIAAVGPLRTVDRCDDAVAALREAWPRVDASRRGAWLGVLDAVAACSDTITLRRNLSFVPERVYEDYLAVLASRTVQQREAQRRAEIEAVERAAEDRARASTARCESECSAAMSSCRASCLHDASCYPRCDSVGHVCRSGCGGF
jgi:hypothetical protein